MTNRKFTDFENVESIPNEFYVIWWRDKQRPTRRGLMWANGCSGAITPMPFTNITDAEKAAQEISARQETKILRWRLEIVPEITKSVEAKRKKVLADLKKMSPEELFQLAVDAGIYTEDGELTEPYKDNDDDIQST